MQKLAISRLNFIGFFSFIASVVISTEAHSAAWVTLNRWTSPPPSTVDCRQWVPNDGGQAECRAYQKLYADLLKKNPSADWEDIYSMWVEHFWKADVFSVEESALEGIATDCAKASYAMRIYFSYLNQLEFRISSGLSNSTSAYDRYRDPIERFQAFVKGVIGQVGTRTLSSDTYPIEISRKSFRPGIIYNEPGGHSFQIGKIDDSGSVTILESSRPIATQFLGVSPDLPSYVPHSREYKDGFRKFLRPEDYGKPFSQLPHYSLQQFAIAKSVNNNPDYFIEKVAELVKAPNYDPSTFTVGRKIQLAVTKLCSHAAYRDKIVLATDSLRPAGQKCIRDKEFFEDYSTYSRDRILEMQFKKYQGLYKEVLESGQRYSLADVSQSEADTFFGIYEKDGIDLDLSSDKTYKGCFFKTNFDLNLPQNFQLTLRRVWQAFQRRQIEPDPNATYFQRWGMENYKPVCPILEETH